LDSLIFLGLLVFLPFAIATAIWFAVRHLTSWGWRLRSALAVLAPPVAIYAFYRSLGSTNVDGDEDATVLIILAVSVVIGWIVVRCLEWRRVSAA
jgi:membrane protein CcdC involved in cytochrome C biogenesis